MQRFINLQLQKFFPNIQFLKMNPSEYFFPAISKILISQRVKAGIILLALLLIISLSAFATLKLPATLGSNMVLQRNSEVKIWGWGNRGERITVKAGWLPNECTANVGVDGKWQAKLPTGNAGGPYKIVISGKDEVIQLDNIMLGEVWVCSGQSNMEFTINNLGGWNKSYPAERDELLRSDFRDIRLFTVLKDTSGKVLDDCKGQWLIPDTSTVAGFSATAWFYGVELYKKLGVPVGLIVSAWGGTPAEAWTPKATIESDLTLQFYRSDPNKNAWFPANPGTLYNAMIGPLLKTTIRGATWYQGEANVNDAQTYHPLFSAMVRSWRQAWGLGDFPFYYVQIAPFTYDRAVVGALLRDAQLKSLDIPNSGMAVTMDVTGDVSNIHPVDKPSVGKRLALWAFANTYNIPVDYSGPVYKTLQKEGKTIRLFFDHSEAGLMIRSATKVTGFLVAGPDRHFIPAKADADGNSIIVKADKVKDPIAVRYAYTNTSEATLFNTAGLPASTFRTDEWPVITEMVFMKPFYDGGTKKILYELSSNNPAAVIHYTTDGTEPVCSSPVYTSNKIQLIKAGTIYARACINNNASETVGSWAVKQHKGIAAKVSYADEYSARYSAGGDFGLVDGVEGSLAFNDGAWQGFEGVDLSVTIDLGEPTLIRKIEMHFLADTNNWIFLPKRIEIKTSQNGVNYDAGSRFDNLAALTGKPGMIGKQIVTIKAPFMKKARYIKLKAINTGICPPGHPGAGEKAWLFVDEVVVE